MLYPKNVKEVIVEQVGSPIARHSKQRLNLIGLGLNKIGRKKRLLNTPETAGMLKKVHHLVKVIPAE